MHKTSELLLGSDLLDEDTLAELELGTTEELLPCVMLELLDVALLLCLGWLELEFNSSDCDEELLCLGWLELEFNSSDCDEELLCLGWLELEFNSSDCDEELLPPDTLDPGTLEDELGSSGA